MPGLFQSINPNATPTQNSSLDLRLLDITCNHQILQEFPIAPIDGIFVPLVYNGGIEYNEFGAIFNNFSVPSSFITFSTLLPFADTTSIQIFEVPSNSFDNPIVEQIIVPSGVNPIYNTQFPPIVNSLSIKQQNSFIDEDGQTELTYINFNNYSLAQLFGNITFTNKDDSGQTIRITYVGDRRKINPKNKYQQTNFEFIGYNSKGGGIFNIYARSFLAPTSSLMIRYTTDIKHCPRCAGKGIVNDLTFDSNYRALMVYDFSKFIQDYFKRLLTRVKTNPFDSTDGSQLPIIIGIGKNNPILIETLIKTEFVKILSVVRNKQAIQKQIQGISLSEQIQQINRLLIKRVNATDIQVDVELLSKSGAIAQIQAPVQGQ